MIAVKAELLETRNPELLIVIILERGHCRAEHLSGEGRHRLGWWVYAIDYSLKLFVSKGGAAIVLLNDPKRRGNEVWKENTEKYEILLFQIVESV